MDVVLVTGTLNDIGRVGTEYLAAAADRTLLGGAIVRGFASQEVIDGVKESASGRVDVKPVIRLDGHGPWVYFDPGGHLFGSIWESDGLASPIRNPLWRAKRQGLRNPSTALRRRCGSH